MQFSYLLHILLTFRHGVPFSFFVLLLQKKLHELNKYFCIWKTKETFVFLNIVSDGSQDEYKDFENDIRNRVKTGKIITNNTHWNVIILSEITQMNTTMFRSIIDLLRWLCTNLLYSIRVIKNITNNSWLIKISYNLVCILQSA